MDSNHFKDKIRQLDSFPSDFTFERMEGGIQHKIDLLKKKKRRRFVIFLFLGIILGTAAVFVCYSHVIHFLLSPSNTTIVQDRPSGLIHQQLVNTLQIDSQKVISNTVGGDSSFLFTSNHTIHVNPFNDNEIIKNNSTFRDLSVDTTTSKKALEFLAPSLLNIDSDYLSLVSLGDHHIDTLSTVSPLSLTTDHYVAPLELKIGPIYSIHKPSYYFSPSLNTEQSISIQKRMLQLGLKAGYVGGVSPQKTILYNSSAIKGDASLAFIGGSELGVSLQKQIAANIHISTGILWQNYNTVFTFDGVFFRDITVEDQIQTIQQNVLTGEQTFIKGQASATVHDQRKIKSHLSDNYIALPLFIDVTKNVSWGELNAGIGSFFTVFSLHSGKVIHGTSDISSVNASHITRGQIRCQAHIGWRKRIFNNSYIGSNIFVSQTPHLGAHLMDSQYLQYRWGINFIFAKSLNSDFNSK